MKIQLLLLTLPFFYSSIYAYVKMPAEVRRIHAMRDKQKDRFLTIKIEPEEAQKVIDFWIPRIQEQLIILSDLACNSTAKDLPLVPYRKLSKFTSRFIEEPTLESFEQLLPTLEDIQKYNKNLVKKGCRSQLKKVAHQFVVELDYFVDLLTNISYTQLARTQFLNRLNAMHIELLKNLIKTHKQHNYKKEANKLINNAKKTKTEAALLDATLKLLPEITHYFQTLAQGLQSKSLKTKIAPSVMLKLLKHFSAQTRYTKKILSEIKTPKE